MLLDRKPIILINRISSYPDIRSALITLLESLGTSTVWMIGSANPVPADTDKVIK